jgi:hypothetical protein
MMRRNDFDPATHTLTEAAHEVIAARKACEEYVLSDAGQRNAEICDLTEARKHDERFIAALEALACAIGVEYKGIRL